MLNDNQTKGEITKKWMRYKFWSMVITEKTVTEPVILLFLKSEGFTSLTDFFNAVIQMENDLSE